MELYVYYILFATIMLFAVVATLLVGRSKKNVEGNPQYDMRTKGNWSRLTWIYIVVILLAYIALIVYIVQSHN
ncbi:MULTISPECIES: hypothetical protein [Paenibacillus]|uniref:hypothetical protein n=1 Tax=Paenibacillus TaxID=44249 RepID=UPI0022B861F1|nr:hypothetical protein [Paenibacillus caseinilyticus]MCZ8517906.1 hypothetical protein [Paenibacillus caseinilyticus]